MCNLLKPKSSNFSTVFCMLVVFLEALRKSINLNHLSSIKPHCIFHGRIYRFTQRLPLPPVYGRIGDSQSRVWPSKSHWNHLKPPISKHRRASLGRSTPSDRHSWRGRGRSARPGGRGPGWICQSPPDLEGHKNWGFWIDFDGWELDFDGLRLDFDGLRLDFDGLRLDFDGLRLDFDGLRLDFDGLRLDFDGLRLDFDGLRLDFDGLRLDFDGLRLDFDGLRLDFDGLRLDFDGLRLNFDGLRLDFDGLRLDQDFAFVAIENAALAATWPQTMHKSPAFRVRFTGPRLKEPRASHRRFHVFFQVF